MMYHATALGDASATLIGRFAGSSEVNFGEDALPGAFPFSS